MEPDKNWFKAPEGHFWYWTPADCIQTQAGHAKSQSAECPQEPPQGAPRAKGLGDALAHRLGRDDRQRVVEVANDLPHGLQYEAVFNFYYRVSPPIADAMRRNRLLKGLMKYAIVYPALGFVRLRSKLRK